MTTIAGAVLRDGTVCLAGDSCVTTDEESRIQAEPKVFVRGPVAIGIVGTTLWESLLHAFEAESYPRRPSAAWLRRELGGHVERAELDDNDSEALIGYGGRLWLLETNGALWPTAARWDAIGSGGPVARGAMWALARAGQDPAASCRMALEAAESLTNQTRRPFRTVTVPRCLTIRG